MLTKYHLFPQVRVEIGSWDVERPDGEGTCIFAPLAHLFPPIDGPVVRGECHTLTDPFNPVQEIHNRSLTRVRTDGPCVEGEQLAGPTLPRPERLKRRFELLSRHQRREQLNGVTPRHRDGPVASRVVTESLLQGPSRVRFVSRD